MKYSKEYIIECLKKYCDFDANLSEQNFEDLVIYPLEKAKCFEDKTWTFANGVTKLVLIFSGLDFVVKIPFNGYETCGEGSFYNDDGDQVCWTEAHTTKGHTRENFYWEEGEYDFFDFEGAECEGGWDYCKVESIKYADAKEEGVESFFAKTECIAYLGNSEHPIYIQERCVTFDDETSSESRERFESRTEDDFEKVRTLQNEVEGYINVSRNWLLDAIIYFGQELVKKFINFCSNYNISDLHTGNIGYKNGAPCLLDYSSYWDSY